MRGLGIIRPKDERGCPSTCLECKKQQGGLYYKYHTHVPTVNYIAGGAGKIIILLASLVPIGIIIISIVLYWG